MVLKDYLTSDLAQFLVLLRLRSGQAPCDGAGGDAGDKNAGHRDALSTREGDPLSGHGDALSTREGDLLSGHRDALSTRDGDLLSGHGDALSTREGTY
jgi:hypothetical protein